MAMSRFFAKVRGDVQVWAVRWGRSPDVSCFLRLWLLEPGFQCALRIRVSELLGGIPLLGRSLRRFVWYGTFKKFGCDIGVDVEIAEGLYLPHPTGIVIHGLCKIGRNVTILQNVTLGLSAAGNVIPPVLEDEVVVNAGAVVLGDITIQRGAIVGANAVVLADVAADGIAVGVPARVIARRAS